MYRKQVSGLSNQPSTSGHSTQKLSYEELEEVARVIQGKTTVRPKIGIICGSGLGGLAESLDQDPPKDVISYKDIPRFPQTTGMCIIISFNHCRTDFHTHTHTQ